MPVILACIWGQVQIVIILFLTSQLVPLTVTVERDLEGRGGGKVENRTRDHHRGVRADCPRKILKMELWKCNLVINFAEIGNPMV